MRLEENSKCFRNYNDLAHQVNASFNNLVNQIQIKTSLCQKEKNI